MKVRIKPTLALAFALLAAGTTVASAQRDHGRGRHRGPTVVVRPPVIVVPNVAPPAPRVERRGAPRRGVVWIDGRWDWQRGGWVWVAGKWERERPGKRWQPGRWEQRGDRWDYVADVWIDASPFPNAAPPAPQDERRGRPRRGQVWVEGRWDWQNGGWVWQAGRWERQKPGKRWHRGEWVQRGDRYEYDNDRWDDIPQYPTAPPPAPQAEQPPPQRNGYIWVAGRYNWVNGDYAWTAGHWERAKAGHAWIPGQWQQQGDHYIWVEGRWN